ncbi:MAG: hybrid sensor histidine kinase/response regulator [Arcobacteraceae bacterium]|nr:hybrid sensor histidine kinase/response regulator [Arcobacteraceae bacterium]
MNSQGTILIIDDTHSNITILLNILKKYDLITAIDGKTALEIVNNERIDLILLDIIMPKMDGYEVCKILKSNPKTSKIPIIFLTSKSTQDDVTYGFNLGAIDYIIKPFNQAELTARVKTHLELKKYQDILEERIKEEIDKNRIKDQILYQTSKQSEIGELLMHIAHQWKQPLSELASLNMYNTAMIKTVGSISNDTLLESFKKNENILEFMSDTIQTFQNYYNPNQIESDFSIIDAINDAINLIDATYNYYKIKIFIKENENPIIHENKNEYSQIILSILNNAKDIFIQRDIKKRTINITIDKVDNNSIVKIEDNAGGIEQTNTDDIFLPFISGKNSTGMGLYMSKSIINKQGGDIKLLSDKNGTTFIITHPLF